MLRRILITLVLLISLCALIATHWLTGRPQAVMTIRVTIPDAQGLVMPAAQMRFDILTRSVRALVDSICHIDVIRPPEQIIRALEDPEREAFLRGAIERRGFVLSPRAQQTLSEVAKTRRLFQDHLRWQPQYDTLIDAVRHIHGPLVDLIRRPRASSILPVRLRQEVFLFNPADHDPVYPDARAADLYDAWFRAVEAYDLRYHRDLVERAIVTAAIYREAAIASVETDSLGQAAFPPVRYGRYWIVGHHPSDIHVLNRVHRRLIARRTGTSSPPINPILIWDFPITITAMLPVLELSEDNTSPVTTDSPP